MKFRFCGDGDCPDWVLAEIHSMLSVLSSVKLKLLTQLVAKNILGQEIDEAKLKDLVPSKGPSDSYKSAVSCVRYFLINATRFGTDEATFVEELQQLGLPKEHATAVGRVWSEHSEGLHKYLEDQSLMVNELEDMSYEIPENEIDVVRLKLSLKNELVDNVPQATVHEVNVSKQDIRMMLTEFRKIRDLLEQTRGGSD